jgi:hypothetical protein
MRGERFRDSSRDWKRSRRSFMGGIDTLRVVEEALAALLTCRAEWFAARRDYGDNPSAGSESRLLEANERWADAEHEARAALALVRKMRADAVEVEAFQTASVSLGGKSVEGPWYATSVQSEAPNAHIRPALLFPLPDSTETDES